MWLKKNLLMGAGGKKPGNNWKLLLPATYVKHEELHYCVL